MFKFFLALGSSFRRARQGRNRLCDSFDNLVYHFGIDHLLPAGIGPVLMLDTDDMLVIGDVVEGLWRSTVPQLGLERKAAVAHRNCRGHFYEGFLTTPTPST